MTHTDTSPEAVAQLRADCHYNVADMLEALAAERDILSGGLGMTLQEAIAELRSVTEGPAMGDPWTTEDFESDLIGEAFARVVAAILNAVVSKELIPASEAAESKAAQLRDAVAPFAREAEAWPDEWQDTANNIGALAVELTKGDFVRARAALQGDKP